MYVYSINIAKIGYDMQWEIIGIFGIIIIRFDGNSEINWRKYKQDWKWNVWTEWLKGNKCQLYKINCLNWIELKIEIFSSSLMLLLL